MQSVKKGLDKETLNSIYPKAKFKSANKKNKKKGNSNG